MDKHVIGAHLRAKETAEPQIEVISAHTNNVLVNYDRIILPQKRDAGTPGRAVTISRLNLPPPRPANAPDITKRERQIPDVLINGSSAKEIAREINLSPRTIENQIANLKIRYCARNVTHLVSLAIAGLHAD